MVLLQRRHTVKARRLEMFLCVLRVSAASFSSSYTPPKLCHQAIGDGGFSWLLFFSQVIQKANRTTFQAKGKKIENLPRLLSLLFEAGPECGPPGGR